MFKPSQLKKTKTSLLSLEFPLPDARSATIFEGLNKDEFPRCITRTPAPPRMIVLLNPLLSVLTDASIEALSPRAPENVNKVRLVRSAGHKCGGLVPASRDEPVWLRGLEPAARDYELRKTTSRLYSSLV